LETRGTWHSNQDQDQNQTKPKPRPRKKLRLPKTGTWAKVCVLRWNFNAGPGTRKKTHRTFRKELEWMRDRGRKKTQY